MLKSVQVNQPMNFFEEDWSMGSICPIISLLVSRAIETIRPIRLLKGKEALKLIKEDQTIKLNKPIKSLEGKRSSWTDRERWDNQLDQTNQKSLIEKDYQTDWGRLTINSNSPIRTSLDRRVSIWSVQWEYFVDLECPERLQGIVCYAQFNLYSASREVDRNRVVRRKDRYTKGRSGTLCTVNCRTSWTISVENNLRDCWHCIIFYDVKK